MGSSKSGRKRGEIMTKGEKIGEDVLGEEPRTSKYDKRKQELLEKAKQEVKKKKAEEDEEIIRLSKLPIPGEKPGELSPEERAEIIQRARLTGISLEQAYKDVHVKEHFRSKPKKKKEQESFFDFP
jgi:hypothetical protein